MSFDITAFENLLPPYLLASEKGRLSSALSQFSPENNKGDITYDGFYMLQQPEYLLQSDVLHSARGLNWDSDTRSYENGYSPAMLISNSCDVESSNLRAINSKEAMFAPLIALDEYLTDYRETYNEEQLNNFCATLKRQQFTNLFYLPPNHINNKEYIVRLDKIYWLPQTELEDTKKNLGNSRFITLSNWGYYLFITKVSFHLCRVPEEIERLPQK